MCENCTINDETDDSEKSVREFCQAIRRNWSLHTVRAKKKFPLLSRAQKRMVRACLLRNTHVELLLGMPNWYRLAFYTDGYFARGSIHPMLFSVAKQAPRFAPTMILLGLIMLSDSVGPSALATVRLRPTT
jgi:hypothetical protein